MTHVAIDIMGYVSISSTLFMKRSYDNTRLVMVLKRYNLELKCMIWKGMLINQVIDEEPMTKQLWNQINESKQVQKEVLKSEMNPYKMREDNKWGLDGREGERQLPTSNSR